MLFYDGIDISEGADAIKVTESKKCWRYLSILVFF